MTRHEMISHLACSCSHVDSPVMQSEKPIEDEEKFPSSDVFFWTFSFSAAPRVTQQRMGEKRLRNWSGSFCNHSKLLAHPHTWLLLMTLERILNPSTSGAENFRFFSSASSHPTQTPLLESRSIDSFKRKFKLSTSSSNKQTRRKRKRKTFEL